MGGALDWHYAHLPFPPPAPQLKDEPASTWVPPSAQAPASAKPAALAIPAASRADAKASSPSFQIHTTESARIKDGPHPANADKAAIIPDFSPQPTRFSNDNVHSEPSSALEPKLASGANYNPDQDPTELITGESEEEWQLRQGFQFLTPGAVKIFDASRAFRQARAEEDRAREREEQEHEEHHQKGAEQIFSQRAKPASDKRLQSPRGGGALPHSTRSQPPTQLQAQPLAPYRPQPEPASRPRLHPQYDVDDEDAMRNDTPLPKPSTLLSQDSAPVSSLKSRSVHPNAVGPPRPPGEGRGTRARKRARKAESAASSKHTQSSLLAWDADVAQHSLGTSQADNTVAQLMARPASPPELSRLSGELESIRARALASLRR